MRSIKGTLFGLYEDHPRLAATLAGAALLVGLTGIHAAMGFTSAFRALYVLPIWLATRMGGRLSGFALVLLVTYVGTATEWQLRHEPGESLPVNLVIRFVSLGCLMLLIAQVEQALQKHQRLALRDPLTGLLNRNALREFAQDAFHRALVRAQPMTVVVIDCDGFKQLNDTYGHSAGDQVLMILARELEEQTRQSDLVARIGGDEFAVVLRDTELDEARTIMHRVDHSFGSAVMKAGYVASLSIGYGSTRDGLSELGAVLELADQSMYESKKRKRASAFLR